ncbi:TonB-dependent receptor [Actomonas aquatica]|uniref:TonB-dependent receptor plug domain-containing protein n=1 Tax=Actomonas aquatica TaxID=2866162 RepID=A0ABZ1CAV4_9BACT|nr:TonB-dependent receptor [Opitutus sp. WL0086]WRQ88671.1 TonB-dependent receptor plug domain-containing protein [Opitutus sp. WL0086]
MKWKTGLVSLWIAGAAPLVGQSLPATELASLEVTARQHGHSTATLPASLQSFDEAFLHDFGLDSLSRTLAFVPGASVQEQSALFPGFSIRGITSDEGDAFFTPRVSVFQDGIAISDTRGALVELFDLQGVEVLKGPQSVQFGRSASSGAIHLLQNQPEFAHSGSLSVGAGHLDAIEVTAVANLELVPDQLTNRFALRRVRHDGYVENLAGGDLFAQDTLALRNSLRWRPSARWDLTLVGNYQKDTPSAVAFKQLRFPTIEGFTGPFGAPQLNRAEALHNSREIASLALTATGQLGDALTLTSITGWRRFNTRRELDADGSQALAFELTDFGHHRQYSQELRLDYAPPEVPWRAMIGAEAYWSERRIEDVFLTNEQEFWPLLRPLLRRNLSDRVRLGLIDAGVAPDLAAAQATGLAQLALPAAEDVPMIAADGTVQRVTHLPLSLANLQFAPPPLSGFAGLAGLPLSNSLHHESYVNESDRAIRDLFGSFTWAAPSGLEFDLGARWSAEDIETRYHVDPGNTPSVLGFIPIVTEQPAYPNAFFPVQSEQTATETVHSVTGQASVSYAWTDRQRTYFTVSRGVRPPVLRIDENGFTRLQPERLQHYELGYKGRFWDERLQLDAALFALTYENFQTFEVENARRRTVDAGRAQSRGVELTAQSQLTPTLWGILSYGYTRFRFNDTGTAGGTQLFAGNTSRLTPEQTASVGLRWTRPTSWGTWTFSPAWTWQSRVYFENSNDPALMQSAYGLATAQLYWNREAWQVTAWIENAFDEAYLLDAGNIGNDLGVPTYVPGPGRRFGLRLTRTF